MKKAILIGGAPTVGKSYIASKLATELGIPWISTDTIRDQMRSLVREQDYPALFIHANPTIELAEGFLNKSTEEIIAIQNKESEDVWKGVKALIDTDYVWDDVIIEGIAILPHFVSQLESKDVVVKSVFLFDENSERIRETIYTRGLWDDADKYPDHLKEKEVEWVVGFNRWLKAECERFQYPMVYIGDRSSYLEKINELIR